MRKFFTSRIALLTFIVLSSGIIVMFLLDIIVLPWIIHSGEEVRIPNVVGKKFEEASLVLEEAGLRAVFNGKTRSDKIPAGYIVIQNPSPRNIVREGRNIYLTVSGGEEEIAIPNLRGRSLRDAKFTLERDEIRIDKIEYQASELPEDIVIAQSISPGKIVKKNTSISVTVSSGAQLFQISVPYLVGLNLQEAQSRLQEAGLRIGVITYKKSSELLPNTIINQSPKAGDMVDVNTPIDIIIVQ